MIHEHELIDKLRRIEALHARPGTDGERVAAERARDRILGRLRELERSDPPVEYRFSLTDRWSRRLLTALMRRYDIRPFRYKGQRRTTVMARVSRRFVEETLWPEFQAANATLSAYFDDLTERVIREALDADSGEAEERARGQLGA